MLAKVAAGCRPLQNEGVQLLFRDIAALALRAGLGSMMMLGHALLVLGPGRVSADHWIAKKFLK